ncbi:hypothetical protein LYNGBM3L_45350 [Moorena producens 3L]|uniref:Uncharacterized protein n=1 Tax=Moorena producens 3L TaxID=489825 RepID=F4XX71_9CYAN|nr:hypothetical protein LYNGBM3L_45350 [Moorena producens 3L]
MTGDGSIYAQYFNGKRQEARGKRQEARGKRGNRFGVLWFNKKRAMKGR